MSDLFPRVKRHGYDAEEVKQFLDAAREAYSTPMSEPAKLTAEEIRHTAFSMRKDGYSPAHVDAALERLEDAFAARERDRALAEAGPEAWTAHVRSTAQAILDRAARPDGHKFKRVGVLTTGYHPEDVDRFARKIRGYFEQGKPLTVDEVRTVAFRPRRGGYSETQVDLVLDSVTSVMLAVKQQ
ncbi:DivIVA domain-containing protein [Lysobacter korlensis]|uniref:DivIVA domain-containing protein n=1 Tax=Lysobacter korlensis TaxID=553636 RepID=A0ABV6RNN1_9GAMM